MKTPLFSMRQAEGMAFWLRVKERRSWSRRRRRSASFLHPPSLLLHLSISPCKMRTRGEREREVSLRQHFYSSSLPYTLPCTTILTFYSTPSKVFTPPPFIFHVMHPSSSFASTFIQPPSVMESFHLYLLLHPLPPPSPPFLFFLLLIFILSTVYPSQFHTISCYLFTSICLPDFPVEH